MIRYLLDSNVVSEPVRAHPDACVEARLAAAGGEVAVASVVWHELVHGMERLFGRNTRQRDVKQVVHLMLHRLVHGEDVLDGPEVAAHNAWPTELLVDLEAIASCVRSPSRTCPPGRNVLLAPLQWATRRRSSRTTTARAITWM